MSNSRIPSPARSQGPPVTPRRYKTRTTRSVGSPARTATASGRLSNIVDQFKDKNPDSFAASPLSKTVLNDNTEIDMPRRGSWWKKVDNSRDVIEVLENDKPAAPVNVLEELDIEVLTQEKKNYTMDLPESSDNESIQSIVVPHRRLFAQTENLPQKKYMDIVNTSRDKTETEDKSLQVRTKSLFSKTSQRPKPVFPSAFLNISDDKTLTNKTRDSPEEVRTKPKGLFGRPATKRKNIFADFIVSESEDEISEVIPKRFTFHKPSEPSRRSSNASSVTTDIDMDDWKLLPSSTMMEHQLEAQCTTPGKKSRLSKLSEAKESINTDSTKQSNKSMSSKNKSKLSPAKNQDSTKQSNKSMSSKNKSKLSPAKNQDAEMSLKKAKSPKDDDVAQKQNTSQNKSKTYNVNQTIGKQVLKSLNAENIEENLENVQLADMIEQNSQKHHASLNKSKTFNKTKNLSQAQEIGTIANEDVNETSYVKNKTYNANQTINKQVSTSQNAENIQENLENVQLTDIIQHNSQKHHASLNKSKSFNKTKNLSQAQEIGPIANEDVNETSHVKNKTYNVNQTINKQVSKSQNAENIQENLENVQLTDIIEHNSQIHNASQNKSNTFNKTKNMSQAQEISTIANEDAKEISHLRNKAYNVNQIVDKQVSKSQSVENNHEKEEDIQLTDKIGHIDTEIGETEPLELQEDNEEISLQYEDNDPEDLQENNLKAKHDVDNKTKTINGDNIFSKVIEYTDNIEKELSKIVGEETNHILQIETPMPNKSIHLTNRVVQETPDSKLENVDTRQSLYVETSANTSFDKVIEKAKQENKNTIVKAVVAATEENLAIENQDNETDLAQVSNPKYQVLDDNNLENDASENQEVSDQDQAEASQEIEASDQDSTDAEQELEVDEEEDEDGREPSQQHEDEVEEEDLEPSKEQEEKTEEQIEESENLDHIEASQEEIEKNDEIDAEEQNANQEMEEEQEDEQDDEQYVEADDDEIQESNDAVQNESYSNEENVQNESLEIEEEAQNESEEDEQDTSQEIAEDEEKNDCQEAEDEIEEEENQEIQEDIVDGTEEMEEDGQDESEQRDTEPRQSMAEIDGNVTHDTTGRNRQKRETSTPEAILHETTNEMNSFRAEGRNTSIRKTLLKNFTIRPSMAPERESTRLSDGTKNSSAEGSGWDSHRTTRKTLRQTFGKDFTPRKSLRTLVMEKSAKRQTQINEANAVLRHQANSTELPDDQVEMDYAVNVEPESDHEISTRTRQTTLEMYVQKIKKENMEFNQKIEKEVRNSFKNPVRVDLNFKPTIRRMNAKLSLQTAPKVKAMKRSVRNLENLHPELVEDMQYKPPKRFKPSNASWITKRLYKFLESKLEPKYDYKARVRAENLVERIYNFARDIRRMQVAPAHSVEALKREVARLDIVKTHFEFYNFIREYMPYEVKIKVVPDIINDIPLPREGVFAAIIGDNEQ